MRHTLKKAEILRGKKNFDVLFKHGEQLRGAVTKCLALYYPRDPSSNTPAVTAGFSVQRTVKRAVDRNRIKRSLREAYRRNKQEILLRTANQGLTLLFLFSYKPGVQQRLPTYQEIELDMKHFLELVNKKAYT